MQGKNINEYIIKDFKGSGTFGSVYTCEKNGTTYAIKIFNEAHVFTEFSHGNDNRITREIEALKSVNDPAVVKYVDDGNFFDNGVKYLYVVMDYTEGQELNEYLENHTLSVDDAITLFKKIVKGISAIHKSNIIHRDLKPANIHIMNDANIKILDFGLSKLIDFTSITSTGAEIGSPLYMSPEQVNDSKNIDYRSDYYALGVILFEMLSKQNPYGIVQSKTELFYKIVSEPPASIRQYIPTIPNAIDNLIIALLDKKNYKRPNSVLEILSYLEQAKEATGAIIPPPKIFIPNFFLRTWDEGTAIVECAKDGYALENFIFPINHQNRQKNLLKYITNSGANFMLDPATMRLAYDIFSNVKGLVELPYAPQGLNRIEIDDFNTLSKKQDYVRKVIDAQLVHNPTHVVAPFHVSNNSNLISIKATVDENWFSLDIKLLSETKDYLNKINCSLPLIGGFCVKTDILTTRTECEYFINVVSSLPCDMFWIYVDCIDINSNLSQLYNYANTLLTIQKYTGKPVIAGRIGSFGLVLLSFGLFGFESGASRFESFYEDLYKTATESYNMYLNYYVPELMHNVPVERKNPAKIIDILSSDIGRDSLVCHCPYCNDKQPRELVVDALSKKHFLFRRQEEINKIRSFLNINQRVSFIEQRIQNAIVYHQALRPIFKDDDYNHLKTWQNVINKLKKEMV